MRKFLALGILAAFGCGGSSIHASNPSTPLDGGIWRGSMTGQGNGAGSGFATMTFSNGIGRGQFEGSPLVDFTDTGDPTVFVQFHFLDYPNEWASGTLVHAGARLDGTVAFRDLSWAVHLQK